MKISAAISNFARIHPKFCLADGPRILQVVDELALSEESFAISDSYIFDRNWRKYTNFTETEQRSLATAPYFDYEEDHQGTVRVHPTMILAKKRFLGSSDRGLKPNPIHRHHLPLIGWTDRRGSHPESLNRDRKVRCPTFFIWVPTGSECLCGERHF